MAGPKQEQTLRLVMKWFDEFHQPFTDSEAQESIASAFSPDIVWTDHAFHIQRQGHEAVLGLRKGWNHCNQPMETPIKQIHYTSTGAVVEAIWVGCCKNDIVRPNGAVVVKANGRNFVNHVCFVVEVGAEADRITKIDEYYNKAWWDGISVDDYQRMKGPIPGS